MADDVLFDRPVYVISVAAELASMHPQTLRLYERRGLLRPQRQPNNRRMYSQHDVQRLQRIQQLTETGLNLAGVGRVLALEELVDRLQAEMDGLHRQLEAEAQRLRDEVARIERSHRRDLVPVRPGTVVSLRRSPGAGSRQG
jgi:MerR family transcriptional regulator, heat shock protein HspR